MDGQHTCLAELLGNGRCPSGLYNLLAKRWKVTSASDDSPDGRPSRADIDLSVGASAETGRPLYVTLSHLSLRRPTGFNKLAFLAISAKGKVSVIHSLFLLSAGEYEEGLGDLCGFVGELPAEGYPQFVRLPPLALASNEQFWGVSREEFDAHVTSLPSVHPQDLDISCQEPVSATDEGARQIRSRGLCVVPPELALQVLQLGDDATISAVAGSLFPSLLGGRSSSFDATMDWMQASFTSREEETFLAGVIRTRREFELEDVAPRTYQGQAVIAHARRQFPGRYSPIRLDEGDAADNERRSTGGLLGGDEGGEGAGNRHANGGEEEDDGGQRGNFGLSAGQTEGRRPGFTSGPATRDATRLQVAATRRSGGLDDAPNTLRVPGRDGGNAQGSFAEEYAGVHDGRTDEERHGAGWPRTDFGPPGHAFAGAGYGASTGDGTLPDGGAEYGIGVTRPATVRRGAEYGASVGRHSRVGPAGYSMPASRLEPGGASYVVTGPTAGSASATLGGGRNLGRAPSPGYGSPHAPSAATMVGGSGAAGMPVAGSGAPPVDIAAIIAAAVTAATAGINAAHAASLPPPSKLPSYKNLGA